MNPTEKPSRLLTWCGRLAWLFLLLVPLSVLSVRTGLVVYGPGLMVFALSCLASLVVLIVLVIASFLPRYRNQRQRALRNSLVALPPVLLFGALLGATPDVPPIHDVSTDPDDVPVFSATVLELRGSDSNSLEIDPRVIVLQREHYPDLATIVIEATPEEAFARARETAESLGWEISNSLPGNGILEATYTSYWFGFVDDVVIRIRPLDPGRSEIDLRSVSRVGLSDLGANAARIRAFSERLGG
jgi:uncharacterized protein (DUF1499 family)